MMEASAKQPYGRSRGDNFLGRLCNIVNRTLSLLVISLVISIAIELLGVSFWWAEQGTAKSAQMVQQERAYLGQFARHHWLLGEADQWVLQKLQHMNEAIAIYGGDFILATWSHGAVYLISIVNTINVFVLRVFVMLFSMPVYLVFGVIGLTRGLVERELRKWGGGHESSSMFHLWIDLVNAGFVLSWIVYLSWPFSLNPNMVVLPFAIAFGFFVMASAHRYKKYV